MLARTTAVALTALALLAGPAWAADPWFVPDDEFLDRFTDELAKLAAGGKCLAPDAVKAKTVADRRCDLTPAAAGQGDLRPEEVYRRARASVFVIGCVKTPWNDGAAYTDGWFGTAWAVAADGVLVTNYHVFENAADMHFGVCSAAGDVYPVTDILAVDKRADVAVFRVDAKGLTPLPVAASPPDPGAWVGLLSHPGNQPFTFTQGSVTRYAADFGGPDAFGERWMGVTAEYAGGSSGGPLLDRTGAVVGLACLTSNIDHDGSAAKRRRALQDQPPKPAESTVQMVVKLAVPVTAIRRVIGREPAGPGLPELANGLRERFSRKDARLQKMQVGADPGDADGLTKRRDGLKAAFGDGCVGLAATDPASATGLELLLDGAAHAAAGKKETALGLLADHHPASDKLAVTLLHLADAAETDASNRLLDRATELNQHPASRGASAFALGMRAKRRALATQDGGERADATDEAHRQFTRVVEKYADVKPDDGPPLGVRAKKQLAGLATAGKLAVGMPAPEITGPGMDDKPLKLSDFRGKVVLLDFWGGNGESESANVPAVRDLRDRLAGRPFAPLGVTADPAVRPAKLKKLGVTWPSFRGAAEGEPGIADAWNVTALPTAYLIDHTGVIRRVWVGPADAKEVGGAVEELVRAAK